MILPLSDLARSAGFFDWRVVVVKSDGATEPLQKVSLLSPQDLASVVAAGCLPSAGSTATIPVFASTSSKAPAQGRFIVHRANVLEEHMHEVIVDLQGLQFTAAGEIIKHGTFNDVSASLGTLKGLFAAGE
jgi:hypothetical protein